MMKILLLGGTGAMGSHLKTLLSHRGDKVVVTSRSFKESDEFVEYRQGNAKDLSFLSDILLEQWDSVVDFMVYTEDEFRERIDILLGYTSQYIFLSTARVYNDSQVPITEQSLRLLDSSSDKKFLATNEYSLLKARQEDLLISSGKNNWTIMRPYITYSEIRLQLGSLEKEDWLYRALHGRTILFSEDINKHYTSLTYGLDVAKGIVKLINNTDSFGEIFNIVCDNAYRWSDILEIYLRIFEKTLGKRPKVVYQNMSEFLKWNPAVYQVKYDRLFDRKFDNTKINNFIDTKEFTTLQEGLERCMESFLKNSEFKNINWKKEAIKDRFVKERTPFSEINNFKCILKYILYRYFIKM